jgi:methionyl aminopeptidase
MINLKTPKEIRFIKTACNTLSGWMEGCVSNLRRGTGYFNGVDIELDLEQYLDYLRRSCTKQIWDTPFSYQRNQNNAFGSPVCISINDEIVHSRPTERKFKVGDVITVDAGLSYGGWNADMARTIIFGAGYNMDGVRDDHRLLIECGQNALYDAYDQCKPGNTLRNISTAISRVGKGHGTPDTWKIWTQDGSLAAHFESEILITEEGHEVLTALAGEET